MSELLPEILALRQGVSRIRIPPSMDVPVTPRIRQIIDTPAMRRLASISQLGLVSLVYPGATHSRLEHSLGVYANALSLLNQITGWQNVHFDIQHSVAHEAFVIASLVHDAGHWPFCHPIEDMGDALFQNICSHNGRFAKHEDRVESLLRVGPIADCLSGDWCCNADDVMAILRPKSLEQRTSCQLSPENVSFFASCLSGPIDVDKLDYLQRDSLHAGVPYGRNFDAERILGSLRVHPQIPKLAIDEKGRTAAEMMVFGRYVMFSEVYWHHTVRAATAMLQRALFELQETTSRESSTDIWAWSDATDPQWIGHLRETARAGEPRTDETQAIESPEHDPQSNAAVAISGLVEGLFGPTRQLHKRVAEFNIETGAEVHSLLARRPYQWLVKCSGQLTKHINDALQMEIPATGVLIDAPPTKLEVDINMDVIGRDDRCLTLGQVSPVASVLANRQFDDHVKRVRIFVPDTIRSALRKSFSDPAAQIQKWLIESVATLD